MSDIREKSMASSPHFFSFTILFCYPCHKCC